MLPIAKSAEPEVLFAASRAAELVTRISGSEVPIETIAVSYTHLRAHET